MHGAFQQVIQFHETFGKPIGDPANPETHDTEFRMNLIKEEYEELQWAIAGIDPKTQKALTPEERMIAIFDALLDMQYVILGAGVCWGLDMGFGFDEVHRSNMTKTAENKRADGKVQKGPNYRPPNLKALMASLKHEFKDVALDDRKELLGWPKPTERVATESAKPEPKAFATVETLQRAAKEAEQDIMRSFESQNESWRPEPDPPEGVKIPMNDFIRDRFEKVI